MSGHNQHSRPFDIPDVADFVPRRLKPWIFIFFVIIIQFSGGLYLAAATDMVGSTSLMQEDILMAGYASLVGMSLNFAVMFRIKFRFSTFTQLIATGIVLLISTIVCAYTTNVCLLVLICFISGWFRMQGTLACNSTIQLWLTPVRDMSVFFCYVYLVVDSSIQISGIATVYTSFFTQWEYMHFIMAGLLCVMLILVVLLIRPRRSPMYIPLLGIDWLGSLLWGVVFLSFTFVCIYGEYYDWWESTQICLASLLGLACLFLNLWRATFLHHPYIGLQALTNRNVVRATVVYMIFFTIMATEHVFEHTYASAILGFDETNIIDMNWFVFIGIIAGVAFTYFTFALKKWRYKTMTAIGFMLAAIYLAWFYFFLDYGTEKLSLFLPLFIRGAASVIISIVFLTSIVQGGLPFTVFPQALTVNGFTGAVMGACFGPAVIGEWLRHTVAKNADFLSGAIRDTVPEALNGDLSTIYGTVQLQALVVSLKEIYGWLLIIAIISFFGCIIYPGKVRPFAFFPKWNNIRRILRHTIRIFLRARMKEV